MKRIKILSIIITLALLGNLLVSCNEDKITPQYNLKGEVNFQFNVNSKGKSKTSNRRAISNASAIVVTIRDQLGDTIYNMEELPLYNFDGTYISKSISLLTGAYQLVEFLVLDQNSNVIYATPKEGSPLDYLVTDPLAIDFNIIKDEVTQVIPEVISTAEFIPDDFGYTTFNFDVVPIFHFQIAVTVYNESTQNFELTTADLSVSGDGNALHTTSLGNITNVITIQDNYNNYTLTIEKTGYQPVDTTFTNTKLKSHENDPIEVHLFEISNGESPIPSSGTFTNSGQSLGSLTSYFINLADLDGDGDKDAFIANFNSPNKIWINDGNGNFTDSGQTLGNFSSVESALEDLDGDGDLDAFVANWATGSNKIWLNDGNGNFIDNGQTLTSGISHGISLGDIDNDGDIDAFVANYNSPNKIWLNDGNAIFTNNGQNLGNSKSLAVRLADLDLDGDLDAFVANDEGQANKIWLNDGNGSFNDSGQSLGSRDSYSLALGDLDSDGDLDAFVANDEGLASTIWLNDGGGNFTDSGQNIQNTNHSGVALGDFDGDGDLDVFVTNAGNGETNKIWLNNGSGIFQDSGQNVGNTASIDVAISDINNDGILDAFLANNSANEIWLGQP